MYVPAPFVVTDREKALAFARTNNFAALVTRDERAGLVATHVPVLVDALEDAWVVHGHIARANAQPLEGEALVIFSGPHAYISPSWYARPNLVPTWDYVAVHVTGRLQRIDEREEVKAIVDRLTAQHEATMPQPWKRDMTPEVESKLLDRIVGFRVQSTEIRGAWKLHQHHLPDDRKRVAAALRERGSDHEKMIADLIERTLE